MQANFKTRIEAFLERIQGKMRAAGLDIGSRTVKFAVLEEGKATHTRKP